jgi:hypothetical protein
LEFLPFWVYLEFRVLNLAFITKLSPDLPITLSPHYLYPSLLRASMPGNFFPSRNSREAPPPVEI